MIFGECLKYFENAFFDPHPGLRTFDFKFVFIRHVYQCTKVRYKSKASLFCSSISHCPFDSSRDRATTTEDVVFGRARDFVGSAGRLFDSESHGAPPVVRSCSTWHSPLLKPTQVLLQYALTGAENGFRLDFNAWTPLTG